MAKSKRKKFERELVRLYERLRLPANRVSRPPDGMPRNGLTIADEDVEPQGLATDDAEDGYSWPR